MMSRFNKLSVSCFWHHLTACSGSGYWGLFKNHWDESFYPSWLSHILTLTCSPVSIMFIGSWLPFPAGRLLLVQDGWAASCLGLCCAAAQSYQSQGLVAKVLAIVSMHLPDLHDLPPLPGPFLQPRSSPSFLRDCSFLSGTLLFWHRFFIQVLSPLGSCHLNSLRAEAQQVISLQIGKSVSCLFINWRARDMPLLFSPGAIKI